MLRRVNDIFDRRWFTNDGQLVKDFGAWIIYKTNARVWALVGAGSVVVRDIQPGLRFFGNPATPIRKIK
jgi:hypothetical protein